MKFEEVFITESERKSGSSRDKFLSRVFGIFNEEIVRIWCANARSPFVDLGRPTIYLDDKHYTLDFLLEDKKGNCFITEMKCEIEYQKYKYLKLIDNKEKVSQLEHHKTKIAFNLFLDLASEPSRYIVKYDHKDIDIQGAALVWGSVDNDGRQKAIDDYALSYVLSTEDMINDLIHWNDEKYIELINRHKDWSTELFDRLLDKR